MHVEVDEAGRGAVRRTQTGNRADADGAVAAEDEGAIAVAGDPLDPLGDRAGDGSHRLDVLRPRAVAVRPPAKTLDVAVVDRVTAQRREQPGGPQRRRRALLSRRVRTGARRCSEHVQGHWHTA